MQKIVHGIVLSRKFDVRFLVYFIICVCFSM